MKLVLHLRNNYVLMLILALATVLRLYKINFQNLWIDEVLTMNDSDPALTLSQFYDGILFWEYIPHLYFFLNRILFDVFGYSSSVARVFAAIIGVLGVYSIYLLGKELHNRKAGLIAAVFLSVNVFHISYSQEIRPYGMLFLFTVFSFYRMVIYIKRPSWKNAIYYGIFTGLILHSHFFGLITIFSQVIILLYFIIIIPNSQKLTFFKKSLLGGIVAIVVFLPDLQALTRVSGVNSFWLHKPFPTIYTEMVKEFFGSAELVLCIVQLLTIYYFIKLFTVYDEDGNKPVSALSFNRKIFSFIIMGIWLFISLIIPLIKSYLDVPMILSRYFINILPVFILICALGTVYIKNKLIPYFVVICFTVVSLIDIFVIKDYYNTVRKTQFNELTTALKTQNVNNDKIITFYGWIYAYYFKDSPSVNIENQAFEDHIDSMRDGKKPLESFWYTDANSRPFNLPPEDVAYLEKNFILDKKIEYFDIWAYHYEYLENAKATGIEIKLEKKFKRANYDKFGNLALYNNSNLVTDFFNIKQGKYQIEIIGTSFPEKPINYENAHLKIKANGIVLADFFLSNDASNILNAYEFIIDQDKRIRFQIIYDNDLSKDGADRNAIISSIKIKKIN